MDDEEMPWRTPSRNSGGKRPRGADGRDDCTTTTTDSGSATTPTPATSSGSTTSQKRKRHGKKRRRARARGESSEKLASNDGDKVTYNEATSGNHVATAATEWGCPACTYLNESSRAFCEMCGTGNPTKPAKETAPSEWSCVACTMKNAPTLRACAVCGTINPNPSMPAVLSIARRSLHNGLFFGGPGGVFGDDGDDDDEGDEDDGSNDGESGESDGSSGSDGSSSDGDGDRRLECPCLECGVTISGGQSSCPECHAPHPFPRRKLKRSDLSSRLHKLARKFDKRNKAKKKTKDSSSKRPKNAYGVSSDVLKKLLAEPKSSKLVDTLQALTHTLAMMDASADSEWGDMHGGAVNTFFVHGFGGSGRSDEGKDTALLHVLASIFHEGDGHFSAEVRLFAVQSINYILKMDRHLFKKEDVVKIVRIYLGVLKQWTIAEQATSGSAKRNGKEEQMIVEECVNGLCGLCGSEGAMLRELTKPAALENFLDFLTLLASSRGKNLHSSVMTNSMELLQKCCAKIKWEISGDTSQDSAATNGGENQVVLAKRIVDLLREFLKHAQNAVHVSALKCLLLVFGRGYRLNQKQSCISTLITSDFILELVGVLTSKSLDEPDDSRQAAVSLLIHLLDSRRGVLQMFVQEKIYEPLLEGIQRLQLQTSPSASLMTHSLKLVSLLVRRVHQAPNSKHRLTKDLPRTTGHFGRIRLDSSPDPDVLAKLLLDFIRADSIPAVSALVKDGADLNYPSIYDSNGQEIEKPLVIAAEVASLAMVRFLINRGVDVHQVGPSGTALHVAALAGRCDVVSFLLECGANPTDVDREGVTVLKRIDEIESAEDEDSYKGSSPVRKLLDLHQRALRRGDDSDESDGDANQRRISSRPWLYGGDDEDDFDEDDDQYSMDGDEGEDDDSGSDDDDDSMSSDEEMRDGSSVRYMADSTQSLAEKKTKKRNRESIGSDINEGSAMKRSRRNSGSEETPSQQNARQRRQRSLSNAADDDILLATPDQIDSFRTTTMTCLLTMLRQIDHKNENRSVLSTLASALEMAPSAMIRALSDADISLLLETVNHLLQDPVMYTRQLIPDISIEARPSSRAESDLQSSNKQTASSLQAAQKAMLASYILALRILQAIVRKSVRESSVFYEIERRGICEQIERLHAHSLQSSQSGTDGDLLSLNDRSGIFGRGMQLLEFLRSNMIESGMLHLHRLKNMTRRLKDLTEESPVHERDMVLTDLVELFENKNSITSHEFKQSNLLEAILSFLMPVGHANPLQDRITMLLDRFTRSPTAFASLVTCLQSVVNQEENLPLLSFFTGKGRELYPLTKQLKIVCTRLSRDAKDEPKLQKMLQLSALTHYQSFEKTIFRCMPVIDAKLTLFYLNLVGHCIHKAVDGKWKKYWVCGFDQTRCTHLLKPVEDSADDVAEVVLHDSQFKLSTALDIFEEVTVDFSHFGDLQVDSSASDSTSNSDEKKRKRQSKKRRKNSSSENSEKGMAVEVQNVGSTNVGKLRGAWYAGEIVDGTVTEIQPGSAYDARLLTSGTMLKDVPAEKIRVRNDVPQVGSVVEVDGLLGEVTRVDNSQGAGGRDVFDVKISRDRERKGISKERVRYPPSPNTPSGSSTGVIEAMSISRLFPSRESSLIAGTVGDKVWVAPRPRTGVNVPIGDFYVAGKIHSFPAGSDAVGPSASVFVEVSFGPNTAVIKVDQSRVTNLSNGRNRLGSSRLLSALNMTSDRASGPPLHRLLQSSAASSELFNNRHTSGSGSALDHLRQLLAHSSSSRESSLSNLLNASSTDSIPGTASTSTDEFDGRRPKKTDEDTVTRLARISKYLSTGEKKILSKCVRPPKMGVVIGYERSENVDAIGMDRGGEEEFGLSTSLFGSRRSGMSVLGDASLTEKEPDTGNVVLKSAVAAAFSEIFAKFDSNADEGRKPFTKSSKKGSKKQKLSAQSGDVTSSPPEQCQAWNIDKFSAFMIVAMGVSSFDDPEGTLVDNCVHFSLHALPSTRRRLLDLQGFLASMADMCKSVRNSRNLLAYLVSQGHNAASLTGDDSNKRRFDRTSSSQTSLSSPSDQVDMKSFPSDQNMLKCLSELRGSIDATPPWKLKYFVQCDVTIDWSNVVKRDSSSDPAQDEPRRLQSQPRTLDRVTSDSPMMKAVHLLSYLYEALPKSFEVSGDVWRNARLSNKLETQLEDVLSVCSGIYPEWCDAVVSECKFFFPRELREKLFQATAFGCTRSLHWFRNQLNVEDASGSSTSAATDSLSNGPGIASDGGIYNHEITISPIPKERVKVNRENLLSSAEAVMKMHGKRKAILDVVFVGEKGYGSGVTAAFYSATAHALHSIEENRKEGLRCWVLGIENEQEDELIRHPNGLFPFPYVGGRPPTKVTERFRMMGRLAGKALMDSRLFPLPFSPQFMKLVLGQRVTADELERVFLNHGKILKDLKRAVNHIEAGGVATSFKIDGMPLSDWLEAVGFTFVDPISQKPLEPKGDLKDVTLDNLKVYVDEVLSLWLRDGIDAQVQAFREGISDVLPVEKLNLLFVDEVLSLLCGDADIQWDTESLTATMKLAHGYTKESQPVQYFVEVLAEMTIPQRREFLLYATGCPNLPSGGFAALRPLFEVVRRVVDTDNVDQALPFARTCTNTLHLPAYSSKQVLNERLHYAIANSAGVIDRD